MNQPSLFANQSGQLFSGAEGEAIYYPDVVPAQQAAAWFALLKDHISWQSGRRQMYEREVDVPRLQAHFSRNDDLPFPLHEVFRLVGQYLNAPFNSVGLNLYRDRHDSVAPHNDKLDTLAAGQSIAVLSLGATRRMVIRQKKPPHRHLDIDLEPGSLLVMSWATQLHYDHGIPKERASVGPRISLAFRVRAIPADGEAPCERPMA